MALMMLLMAVENRVMIWSGVKTVEIRVTCPVRSIKGAPNEQNRMMTGNRIRGGFLKGRKGLSLGIWQWQSE